MDRKRKIAVIVCSWSHNYFFHTILGIRQRALEENTDVYVFLANKEYLNNSEYLSEEYNIFRLPDLTAFDGVILITSNAFDESFTEVISQLTDTIQRNQIPAITLDRPFEGIPCIRTDNYEVTRELVEHLVMDHHYHTFQFVGGPADHVESMERERAFRDVLAEHGLTADPARIFHYNFLYEDGTKAFHDMISSGLPLPDAVICANDNMALTFMAAAKNHGYKIPFNFAVTGFDNMPFARDYAVAITSVDRSQEKMGNISCKMLLKSINGQEIPMSMTVMGQICYRESCGCHSVDTVSDQDYRHAVCLNHLMQNQYQHDIGIWKNLLVTASDIENCMDKLDHILPSILKNISDVGLSFQLNTSEYLNKYHQDVHSSQSGYDKKVIMTYAWHNNQTSKNYTFSSSLLLPDFLTDEQPEIYFFSPIYFKHRNFGYLAMKNGLELIENDQYPAIIDILQLILENLRAKRNEDYLRQMMEYQYITDSMTKTYNRLSFYQIASSIYDQRKSDEVIFIMFLDMNGLKKINDTYGHEAGDSAIKLLSSATKRATPKDLHIFRWGGDEFLLIGTCHSASYVEKLKSDIKTELVRQNNGSNLVFDVSCSIGYCISDQNAPEHVDELIRRADQEMYREKVLSKQQRTD